MLRPTFSRLLGAVVASALSVGLAIPAGVRADSSIDVTMTLSSHPVSGSSFTFTPQFPDGFVVPADAICAWELRWGDAASLRNHTYNETFGSVAMRGHATDGYCKPWKLTLPYSASAEWMYNFAINSEGETYDLTAFIPGPDLPTFRGSNGVAPGTGIASSTIAGVWLSLPKGAIVGDRVTATAHAMGGYVQPPGGAYWLAGVGTSGSPTIASQTNHRLTFTFTASVAGTISVFYNDTGEVYNGNFAGAGIDPRVRKPAPPAPAPTPRPTLKPTARPSPTPRPTPSAAPSSVSTPSPPASPTSGPSGLLAAAGLGAAPSPTVGPASDLPAADPQDGWPIPVMAVILVTLAFVVAGSAAYVRKDRRPG
jgi:hypothetical protein